MIPHTRKFPLRTELLRFRSRANKLITPHLILYSMRTTTPSRLSVTVPKKVSKLATMRNSLKRLTYDTLWTQIKDQKIDMVVVFKPLPLKKTEKLKMELINELTQSIRSF